MSYAIMFLLYSLWPLQAREWYDYNHYDEKSEQKDVASEICNSVIHINENTICRFYINILKIKQGLFMQILYETLYYLALLTLHVQ